MSFVAGFSQEILGFTHELQKISIPGRYNRIIPELPKKTGNIIVSRIMPNSSELRSSELGGFPPQAKLATVNTPEIYDDNDDYSITPLSEDIDNSAPDSGQGSASEACGMFTVDEVGRKLTNDIERSSESFPSDYVVDTKKDIVKHNNIWTIVRTNIVSLSKQIFQVIYNRVITRNSEKYLDILNIRSPSWELYARKNKPLRIPSKCSNDNFKNYVAV